MKKYFFVFAWIIFIASNLNAQEKLYRNAFPLSNITLLDGPFKHALDLNVDVLLQYDTDRLLAPFLHEAGLPKKAEFFPNWQGLDGHIAGHYLSALAIHYAATGNKELQKRMEYIIAEMKRVQEANDDGYIGGVPNGNALWHRIRQGEIQGHGFDLGGAWVPWYNVHKTFAGLRDAWLYTGNEEAKKMFLKLCDWGIDVTASLTDEQMKAMLRTEYGGMNEVYADAYQMTNDERYLVMAKRFGDCYLFASASVRRDELDNLHANTQVPKAVGYQRTGEVSGDEQQTIAGEFFWETVVNNRSVSIGGNSRREHFPPKDDRISYMHEREGPESCNTYNMMKLAKGLFRMNPQAKFADYYERAMFNHILSTQHPEHGGYVYFTSMRPGHYRNYSAPNSGMWCCVGTGLENHGKYGEFIYTHVDDTLYVNLFVASELDWKDKGIKVIQNTNFPNEENTKLTINTENPSRFTVKIRSPWWVQPGTMKVVCDGRDYAVNSSPSSYIAIDREWQDGDTVEISFPMKITLEELPNVPEYVSILRGPIVLGTRMGTHDLRGLLANDHRWAHIAHGALVSLFDTPPLIGTREAIQTKLENMQPVAGKPFHFTVPDLFQDDRDLIFEPFFGIHDSRYMVYWYSGTQQEYDQMFAHILGSERQRLILDARTIDAVNTGEQQPEADHLMRQQHSETGMHQNEAWRHALSGGFFQYEMQTEGLEDLFLMVRYWGNETGNRTFDIFIDERLLATENISGKWNKDVFVNVEYKIPAEMRQSKERITVKFSAREGNIAGGVFDVRLLKSMP
ncbi:MAG: glycoside hydrolase family 127 protein [Planctomycetaceae bacterium]|nr:glycoside hydrolase family 127 protein [Planctomycetaceae bacterium]